MNDYARLIAKAAAFARGDRLGRIYKTIEGQKTISTRKLERILDDMHEDFRKDAIFMQEIADKISR